MGRNKIIKGSIPSPLEMDLFEDMMQSQMEEVMLKEKELVKNAFLSKLGRPYEKGDNSKFKVDEIDAEDRTLNLLFEDVLFGTVVTKFTDTNFDISFIPTM